jgi:NACHT domain
MNELVDLSSDKPLERRRLRRQFEAIGDRIIDELSRVLEVEFSGLPKNEVTAAALLAEEALEAAQLDADDFAVADGDPRQIEAQIRKAGAERIESAYLSEPGERLFDQLLREATNYLVELVVQLPPFQVAAAQESLRRESLLLERVDQVFRQLPRTPQFLGGDRNRAAANFETEYRRALARALDEVELFGLDLPEHRRRYNLNVAYISLDLELKEGEEEPSAESQEVKGAAPAEGGEGEARSGHVLDGILRALITGEAGSGKTTLLQWLAVGACQGALSGWGDPVPFFIPLRRSAKEPPPAPEDFLALSTPTLAGVMPEGWVHDILAAGRGLVLIDGVDELPPERRGEVRHWLAELTDTFPDSRYVVTSRPPAVEEGWLDDRDFAAAELQPMSYSDIVAFVDHWHEAAIEDPHDDEEGAGMKQLAASLQEEIRTDRAVRSLATSPLLCAMLCALNRNRKSALPRGRLEIYEAAFEGLIDRRDEERKVASGLPARSLSLREKRVLLRDLSYWLLVNGYADAPVGKCIDRVRQKLESMPHIEYSAEDVFTYLLTRSGILREPVPGRIDFLHRTFQEYLAAAEVIEQDSIGQLVGSAHRDEWREVTILSAGQARRDQREDLLDLLIGRGRAEPENRHRLFLLAIACLDASVEMSPARTEELKAILNELIPPRTFTDAIALATAGELAVPALGASWEGTRARTTAACVRSLGLIGGELSLSHLEKIAPDRRSTVGKEIVRMWAEFDQEEYARRVLSKSPMFKGRHLRLAPAHADLASHLSGLAGLQIAGLRTGTEIRSLEAVAKCEGLEILALQRLKGGVDLAPLEALPLLKQLAIRSCEDLHSVETISRLRGLTFLELWDLVLPEELPLSELQALEVLSLDAVEGMDLMEVGMLEKLHTLEIAAPPLPQNLDFLRNLRLRRLRLTGAIPSGWEWLEGLAELKSLTLEPGSGDLSALFALPALRELELWVPESAEIKSSEVSDLSHLILRRAGSLTSLDFAARCPELLNFEVSMGRRLENLSPLQACPKLRGLSLRGAGVSDLSPLSHLQSLRRVDLRETQVAEFAPLANLPHLEYVIVDPERIPSATKHLTDSPAPVHVSSWARAVPFLKMAAFSPFFHSIQRLAR